MNLFILAAVALTTSMAPAKAPKGESIEFKQAKKTILNVKVDGTPVKVNWYVDNYVTRPNRPEDQLINVYIPQNATKESPIMFYVNNGGWQANAYPKNTMEEGKDYNGTDDRVGVALKRGYVVVSYGCRSRNNGQTDGRYLGHSPATMTDTKAAIRYLRHNKKALPAGNTERIVVTGTSGGGALSTVIAASGNSSDYYESLYEIGAAGITKNADGTYSSAKGYGDNVFAVIGYCPITDLGHAGAGYEWLFQDTRKVMYLTGEMNYDYASESTILNASKELAAMYASYLNTLGLKDEQGNAINSSNLREYIIKLMKEEITKTIQEEGVDQMKKDMEKEIRKFRFPGAPVKEEEKNEPVQHRVSNGWLTFNEDGTFNYDLDKHLYYLAKYTTLKAAPSFSNKGLYKIFMNEDTLFGTENDDYCPFNAYSWNHDTQKNAVGKDDTGKTWDEFMKTPEGQKLALNIKMTCAMAYLLENKSDTAPYWYVRHGMDDRDAAFSIETTLFYSVKSSPKVKENNVGFAWLKPHSGDYDVPEAYQWLQEVLDK